MRRATLLALTAMPLVAACGSTSLSSGQLRDQATRVCTLASARTDRIAAPADPAGGAAFLDRGLAVLRPELTDLRTLRPPGKAADIYTMALNAFSHKLSVLDEIVRDLQHGDDPGVAISSLQHRLAPIERKEDRAWRALGIPACVNR